MQKSGQKQQQNDGSKLMYWLWLGKINGIGSVTSRLLLEKFKSPGAIYHADYSELLKVSGVGEKKAKWIIQSRNLESAQRTLENCEKNI